MTSIVEKKNNWKSMGPINCLVTIILQNIFFCVQHKKETLITGLEQLEGDDIIFINYPFKREISEQ